MLSERQVGQLFLGVALGDEAVSTNLGMSPAGFFAAVAMPFAGRALGRGTYARWAIAAGLLTMAAGGGITGCRRCTWTSVRARPSGRGWC